jgi:uncharacterized protein (DUF2126 family)
VVKTALTIQIRDGHLYVFMPPLKRVEDYIELLGVVESTARAIRVPVAIEGYAPPRDPQLRMLGVTPDRRDRSQRPSGVVVAGIDRDDRNAL